MTRKKCYLGYEIWDLRLEIWDVGLETWDMRLETYLTISLPLYTLSCFFFVGEMFYFVVDKTTSLSFDKPKTSNVYSTDLPSVKLENSLYGELEVKKMSYFGAILS